MAQALEVQVGKALLARGWWLAVAESCTGGLVGHRLTQVPGSSAYFLGGIIAYANSAKMALLGVREETLVQYGAVSERVALQMARGARRALGADVAVAVTGIAGPGGASPGKPVGLTWLAVVTPQGERSRRHVWRGNRAHNKERSARAALVLLMEAMGKRG
jgi:PncC family amidohydrolase